MVPRLTVEHVERLLEAGLLADGVPLELIDGVLVYKDRRDRDEDPMGIGPRHNVAAQLLAELVADLRLRGCSMQVQGPVQLHPTTHPSPMAPSSRGMPASTRIGCRGRATSTR